MRSEYEANRSFKMQCLATEVLWYDCCLVDFSLICSCKTHPERAPENTNLAWSKVNQIQVLNSVNVGKGHGNLCASPEYATISFRNSYRKKVHNGKAKSLGKSLARANSTTDQIYYLYNVFGPFYHSSKGGHHVPISNGAQPATNIGIGVGHTK